MLIFGRCLTLQILVYRLAESQWNLSIGFDEFSYQYFCAASAIHKLLALCRQLNELADLSSIKLQDLWLKTSTTSQNATISKARTVSICASKQPQHHKSIDYVYGLILFASRDFEEFEDGFKDARPAVWSIFYGSSRLIRLWPAHFLNSALVPRLECVWNVRRACIKRAISQYSTTLVGLWTVSKLTKTLSVNTTEASCNFNRISTQFQLADIRFENKRFACPKLRIEMSGRERLRWPISGLFEYLLQPRLHFTCGLLWSS